MRKERGKTFVVILMCMVMVFTSVNLPGSYVNAASETTYTVGYWVLKEGQERPTSFDEYGNVGLYWCDWGTASGVMTTENDEEAVGKLATGITPAVKSHIGENQTIKWFAMRQIGYRYQIYGEIVDDKEEVVEPTPEVTYTVGYWVLKEGQERPTSFDEYGNVGFYWCDWGTASGVLTTENDEEAVGSVATCVTKAATSHLGENQTIKWFAMRQRGYRYQIYGEIVDVDKDEQIVKETVKPTVVPTAKATVAPTAKATVAPTAEPTVAPTAKPTAEPTVAPTVKATVAPTAKATVAPTVKPTAIPTAAPVVAFFQILKEGQERPTTFDEISQKEFYWGNQGRIVNPQAIVNDEELVASKIVTEGSQTSDYITDGEDVVWYAMKPVGYSWRVYGQIINVKYENSKAEFNPASYVEFDTVADMQKYNKKVAYGTTFTTKGFYTVGDGGAATYKVQFRSTGNKYSSYELPTGQFANIVVENKTINVLQLGAGHCKQIMVRKNALEMNDDAERINEAVTLIDAVDGGVLFIPKGEYRCGSKIYLGGDNYTVQGEGSKSILYTDNGYVTYDEHFITVIGDNLSIDKIRVEARETYWAPYYRQVSLMFCNNISITNSEFIVEENVVAGDGNTNRQYTNVTLYTGWHNVKIDNCKMFQLGCVERGASLGIIDMWSNGCSGVSVTNCVMKQNAHDEMLGIFTKTGADAAISDIYIANNKMYAYSAPNVSDKTMAITIAYDDSKQISNVVFENNYVKAEVPSNFMTFGAVKDCYIQNNTFDMLHTSNTSKGVLFDARPGVTIRNNDIVVASETEAGLSSIFKRDAVIKDNRIDADCYTYTFMYDKGQLIGNTINMKCCGAFALNPESVIDNKITINGYMHNFAKYDSVPRNSTVTGNMVDYLCDDHDRETSMAFTGYLLYAGFHASINEHIITFSDNVFNTPNISSKNKGLLAYGIGDETPQKMIIKNNQVGSFRWIRNLYGQKMTNVETEENYDSNGDLVTLETRLVYCLDEVE